MDKRAQPPIDSAAELDIQRVRRIWAFSRDQGDWDALAACFHPDATVNISWYQGSAAGFLAAARESGARQQAGESSRHWLGNFRAWVSGERAVLETDVQILTRDRFADSLVDCTSWGRFFDRFERREGTWRILDWTAIYERDRLDPVIPGSLPADLLAGLDLAADHGHGAFMRLRLARKGRQPSPAMVLGGSDAEARLKREAMDWLHEG